ncbi:hypothetical protein MMC08_005983 [Hypocenomyce scalaris]|nr:hypothetical protein [Hypocenomyce scalaris]
MSLRQQPLPSPPVPHYEHSSSPPPSSTSTCFTPPTYPDAYSVSPPESSHFEYKQPTNYYLESTPPAESFITYSLPDYQYMPTTSQPHHPRLCVQQSTPSPGGSQPVPAFYSSMLDENNPSQYLWNQIGNRNHHLSPQAAQRHFNPQDNVSSHKRASSGSSIASGGPASPYTPTSAFPRIVDSESAGYDQFEGGYSGAETYSKPPLTPAYTPVQDSFLAPAFQDYNPSAYNAESLMAVQTAMSQAVMMENHGSDMGGSAPATQGTSYGGEYNSTVKTSKIPGLDRTMSEIYGDELYNPETATSAPAPAPTPQARAASNQSGLLSPYRTVFSERLQAANNGHLSARSQSPTTTTASRERSPFRQGSEFAAESYSNPSSPVPRLGSAAQMRERLKAEADAIALAQHQPSANQLTAPRTISPKEALLDYSETEDDAKMPSLFPQESHNARTNSSNTFSSVNPKGREASQSDPDDNITERSYGSMATSRRQSSSNYSTSPAPGQSGSNFTFVPPAVPGSVQMPQQYPFISQSRRQSSVRSASDQVPEFPTTLTSMESTKSENMESVKSENMDSIVKSETDRQEGSPDIQRPSNTMADSGTYTCTYHGCPLRFETPAKLQKHKREGHRQSTPSRSAQSANAAARGIAGSDANSDSSTAANRNSQAGPHKCERINPSTGKPCNTIFSRPYDLTRHEDTIHNARKQKVRCHMCTEEKTFSRNDALTRHMRVVHPEIDFPGKTKRRG